MESKNFFLYKVNFCILYLIMILTRFTQKEVSSSENTVLTLLGPNSDGVTLFLENQSGINFIDYRFQSSENNLSDSYTNLEDGFGNFGVSGILPPNAKAMVSIRSTAPYIRLTASSSGGSQLGISVTQFVSSQSSYFTNGVQ